MKLTIESKFKRSELLLPNGQKLVFLDVLGIEENVYLKEECNCNVFLVAINGEIIWRIAYHEGFRGHDPFTNVYLDGDQKIIGCTWDGWSFEINLENGSLIKLGLSR